MNLSDFNVKNLGKAAIKSPLKQAVKNYSPVFKFVDDSERILYDVSLENFHKCKESGE